MLQPSAGFRYGLASQPILTRTVSGHGVWAFMDELCSQKEGSAYVHGERSFLGGLRKRATHCVEERAASHAGLIRHDMQHGHTWNAHGLMQDFEIRSKGFKYIRGPFLNSKVRLLFEHKIFETRLLFFDHICLYSTKPTTEF